jgi:hypothetical protein|tara:strand:- start:207 stop:377 length:171 start_codon:yes stop_codon:yes gene_type:complete
MAQVIGAFGGNIMSNGTTIASNQTLTSGNNYMSVGPITINSGVTLTINSGVTYTIV